MALCGLCGSAGVEGRRVGRAGRGVLGSWSSSKLCGVEAAICKRPERVPGSQDAMCGEVEPRAQTGEQQKGEHFAQGREGQLKQQRVGLTASSRSD